MTRKGSNWIWVIIIIVLITIRIGIYFWLSGGDAGSIIY